MQKAFDYVPEYKKTILSNGIRVVTEHHPSSRATSAGIYIDLGSRDEPAHLGGAAHFIEHLVFKGTNKRNAYEIVKEIEAVGGELNAYTTREYTCFHSCTLREHLSLSMDVLSDLVSDALFDPVEFDKERQVILQEIMMASDDLEEYIFDMYFEGAFPGNPLSNPILGTVDSINAMKRDELFEFYQTRYKAEHLVVSVAGSVNHDEVVALVEKNLLIKPNKKVVVEREVPSMEIIKQFYKKDTEQVHYLLGLPSSSFKNDSRFESYIVNAFLGGGMTSQLYQKIREEKALAYTVYSYLQSFTDSGLMMFYVGTSEDKLEQVSRMVIDELKLVTKNGLTSDQLNFYKRQVRGQIMLGADDIENRMNSLAVNEMVFSEYRPVDSVISEIEKVSVESSKAFIDEYFDFNKAGCMLLGKCEQSLQDKIFSLI